MAINTSGTVLHGLDRLRGLGVEGSAKRAQGARQARMDPTGMPLDRVLPYEPRGLEPGPGGLDGPPDPCNNRLVRVVGFLA